MGRFWPWPRALRPLLFLWFFKCLTHPFRNFLDPPLPFAAHEYPYLHFPSLYVGQGFKIAHRIGNNKTDQSQSSFYEWNCVIQFSTNPAEIHSLFTSSAKDHDFPRPWKKLSPSFSLAVTRLWATFYFETSQRSSAEDNAYNGFRSSFVSRLSLWYWSQYQCQYKFLSKCEFPKGI